MGRLTDDNHALHGRSSPASSYVVSLALGFSPVALGVTLTPGSVFAAGLTNTLGDWADGDVIALIFDTTPDPTEWDATIDGPLASWTVLSTDVDAVITAFQAVGGPAVVRLWYTTGGVAVEWATGLVRVSR